MEENKLLTYSIMSLDTENLEEICEDIKKQYETGVSTCPLFKMTLVPEGKVPVNKAEILSEKYMMFKQRLDRDNIPNGILVQATIGHGWVLGEMFPYQQLTNLTDGKTVSIVCPYDEGFREYIYEAMKTITKCNPDMIMIDDDFRLIIHGGKGCACPLHMKRFNEIMQTNLTREEMVAEIEKDSELGKKYYDTFVETQRESLVETAKIIRAGIDSVNPKQLGSFCCVGNNVEFAEDIAPILAGEGNPVIVRINNAAYCQSDIKAVTRSFYKGASQIQKLKNSVDYILAETDTCPQNRYSTSASMLHAHYTGTILEGAIGAKQWITRLAAYEPESGIAYRKKLSKFSKFYEETARLVKDIKWFGFRMPVLAQPKFKYEDEWYDKNYWYDCVLNRFGLPVYFSAENGGITCLEGDRDKDYSDNEIREMLKGCVFLASDTAYNLIQRGFGDCIGVLVEEHNGKKPMGEMFNESKKKCSVQASYKKLTPINDEAKELSMVYNTIDDINLEKLFSGVISYENEIGGTVYTFCGTPKAPFTLGAAFSFLNSTRKAELIKMVKGMGELPVYYPGDEEVYLKAGRTKENKLLCALFNVGYDKIENIELVTDSDVKKIEYLDYDGRLKEVGFEVKDGKIFTDVKCDVLEPVIFVISD